MIEPDDAFEGERPKSLTYFPFLAADWLTSPKVRALAPAARGALVDLLAWSWRHDDCAIPAEEDAVAGLSGLGAEWPKYRAALLAFFPLVPGKPSLRRSPTLHRRYVDALAAYESRAGAARARWDRAKPAPVPATKSVALVDAALASRVSSADNADVVPPLYPSLADFADADATHRALLYSLAAAFGDEAAARMALAECAARLDGMHGPIYSREDLAAAIADFLSKHADKRPGFTALKRFLAVGNRPKVEAPATRRAPRSPSPAMLGHSADALAAKYL